MVKSANPAPVKSNLQPMDAMIRFKSSNTASTMMIVTIVVVANSPFEIFACHA